MNNGRRANLFLTELVFDVLIFALCAAVCAALLVHARSVSRESRMLTDAVALAQTTAETLRGTAPESGSLERDGLRAEYTGSGANGVVTADIRVYAGDEELYTLTAAWPEVRP